MTNGFAIEDFRHTANLLRSDDEAVRKATLSNNFNIILAALDALSAAPYPEASVSAVSLTAALRDAKCTSPDGTFVHASTREVVSAVLSAAPQPPVSPVMEGAVADHKWLDPECGVNGCQSLVWQARYEAAVKGRAEFRRAYREARDALKSALVSVLDVAAPVEGATVSPSDPATIIAGIRQFGLASDGSDLRDLASALAALEARLARLREILKTWDTPTGMPLVDLAKARVTRLQRVEEALSVATQDKLDLLDKLDAAEARLAEMERENERLTKINADHCRAVNTYIVDNARQEEARIAAEARAKRLEDALREERQALATLSQGLRGPFASREDMAKLADSRAELINATLSEPNGDAPLPSPQGEDWVCEICDGGPGNSCACSCPDGPAIPQPAEQKESGQ